MEITIDTTSNKTSLSNAIQQFFDQNNMNIPDNFKQMFILNYKKRNLTFVSEELYQIFKSYGYKTKYYDFCKRFIRILNQVDFKEIPFQNLNHNKIGHKPKQQYEITYKGYQKIMMRIDDTIADYFVECESLLTAFFDNYVEEQQIKLKEKEEQIEQCKRKCHIYRIDLYDNDEDKIIKGQYIGSSCQILKRVEKHRHFSSNPSIYHHLQNGAYFTYIFEEERRCIEQRYIDKLPSHLSLNISKHDNSYDVSSIQILDMNEEIIEPAYNHTFSENVNNLKQYLSQNNKYPNKRSTDNSIKQLGNFVMMTRVQLNNPDYKQKLSEQNKQYLFEQIPDFIVSDKEHNFNEQIHKLSNFIKENNSYPSRVRKDATIEEKKLGKFVQHLRSSKNNKDTSILLTEQRLKLIDELIPNFKWISK